MSPELQHELQKLNSDLAAAIGHLPNALLRGLALAVVARLVKILFMLAEGK